MAVLPTDRASGDTIESSDIDAIATQVNTNTTAIAGKMDVDGGNLTSDNITAFLAKLGTSKIILGTDGIDSCTFFFQGADPTTTINPGADPDATDMAAWFYPAGS